MKIRKKTDINRKIRYIIQAGFFTFVFVVTLIHYLQNKGINLFFSAPNLHAICPFGAVETFGRLLTENKFIPKTYPANLWMFFSLLGAVLVFGNFFCGWLCPLGSVQDWIGKIGRKLFGKKYNTFVPIKWDKILCNFRYIFLVYIIIMSTVKVTLVFKNLDPYYALMHLFFQDVLPSALLILIIVLTASLFVHRPWCRWICPLGGLLGLVSRFSFFKIRRNTANCSNCRLCDKNCPMHIKLEKAKVINDTLCNKCGECLSHCNRENGLEYSAKSRKKYAIASTFKATVIFLAVMFTPVIIASAAGQFKASNKAIVKKGKLKPEDIKATMTLQELTRGINININELKKHLQIPLETSDTEKLMNLEDINENVTLRYIRQKMEEM